MFKKLKSLNINSRLAVSAVLAFIIVAGTIYGGIVRADSYDQQIQALQNQKNANQALANQLAQQASSYQGAIDALQTQIDSLQQAIVASQQKSDALQAQINQAQVDLAHEKLVLGENIKTMYLEGKISTLEILASSRDLSEYINKQTYRNSVQNQVKTTLDKITALKAQMEKQQTELQTLIKQQQAQQSELADQQNQQSQLLSYTEGQKAAYDSQIKSANSQIVSLRAQQAAAIRALQGSNGTSAVGSPIVYNNLTGGVQCGGGYPYCGYGLDQYVADPWGLFLARECVHYVAWGLSAQGINVHFNGNGNANQWAGALSGMATINNDPTGAQMVYLPIAPLGHVAMIDQDYGNGWVHVSQYNWQPGMYSTMDLKVTSNLLFFHFN